MVNFQGVIRERTDVYEIPRSDIQYFYSYRARAYYAYPVWYDETRVNQYTEGTLNVDIIDAQKRQLIWEGTAVGRVGNKQRDDRAAALDASIVEIFSKYPFCAGN